MQQQRKPPSKRYSSYMPPTELSTLEDHISTLPDESGSSKDQASIPNHRSASVGSHEKVLRRRSLNTLHFDALQSAVSKLSRIDDFDLEELGCGFFSDVFKVTHKLSGKVMVLKRNKNTNTKMNILREVQLMNRLSHPNILKFMGVCVHEGQLHALTEFINGGDLDQLVQRKTEYLSWTVRVSLAIDTCKGLSYLHSMGIFHRDLTAKNCLVRVTNDGTAKKQYTAILADLGLAEKIPSSPEDESKLKIVGTPYCMAPEVLCDKRYNKQSDFFSFGLIICQLIIRTPTEPDKLPRSNDFGLAKDLFLALVTQGVGSPEELIPNVPQSMPPASFMQLAFDCCEVDPSKRPNITEIGDRLESTLRNVQDAELSSKSDQKDCAPRLNSVLSMKPSDSNPDKENVEKYVVNSELPPSKVATKSHGIRRSSAPGPSSRFCRSSSDITKEWISHVASMIASSREKLPSEEEEDADMSSVMSSLNDAFSNPFSKLERPEIQERKLIDEPSSELLEMTFDLPSPKLHPSRLRPKKNLHGRRSGRPKSLLLGSSEKYNTLNQDDPLHDPSVLSPRTSTPDAFSKVDKLSDSCQDEAGPCDLPSQGYLSDPFKGSSTAVFPSHLKQASVRAMALSPQGCCLLSWWHSHSRSTDWRSLTSVLSVMADKLGKVRRSISVPDLSQDSCYYIIKNQINPNSKPRTSDTAGRSLPSTPTGQKPPIIKNHPPIYPSYATLPKKSKMRCRSSNRDPGGKRRSRTYDDVFQDPNLLEILHEEAGESKPVTLDASHTSSPQTSDALLDVGNKKDSSIVSTVQDLESSSSALLEENWDSGTSCSAVHPATVDGQVSSSSSSSGTSSSGLRMTIQTGVVSSNRRRRTGILSSQPKLSSSPPLSCSNSKNRSPEPNPSSHISTQTSAYKKNPCQVSQEIHEQSYQEETSKSNRDSGYDEVLMSPDHSNDSLFTNVHKESETISKLRPSNVNVSKPVAVVPKHNTCANEIIGKCKIKDYNGNESPVPLVGDWG